MNLSLCRRRPLFLLFALVGTLTAASVSAQSIIYAQNFGRLNDSSGRQAASGWGWSGVAGTSGGLVTLTADTSSVHNFGIGSDVGRPIGLSKVNASGTDEGNQGRGLLFFTSTTATMNFLMTTAEYSFDPADYSALSVTWWSGNSLANGTQRLAVQIGGNWYATSDQVATAPNVGGGSGFAGGATSHTVDFYTANWVSITTSAQLSLGSAMTLPTGAVTAFGIYAAQTSPTTHRFDSFQVAATEIPEPAALAGLFGAAVLALVAWRRRRVG